MDTKMRRMSPLEDEAGLVDMDEGDAKGRKRKLQMNFGALCVIWLFTFTAYSGLQNLETALYQDVGLYTLAALTGGGVIACLLAPTAISYIGSKGALIVSWICLSFFVAANFFGFIGSGFKYLLVVAGGVEGLSTGLMWTAQGSITTTIAMEYHEMIGEPMEKTLSTMFGIFCMFFQSTQVWGNLISSLVLQQTSQITKHESNFTFCGADFCPSDVAVLRGGKHGNSTGGPSSLPEPRLINILTGIYLGSTAVGLLITIAFLKPVKSSMSDSGVTLKVRLLSTVRLLFTNLNMFMLVPFSLYTGMEQVVMYAEFTNSFVACKLGIEWIGYTMICFGVCDTVGSLLVGFIGKFTGRPPLFIIATILNLGVLGIMRFWSFKEEVPFYLFFVIPGVWGLADGIWQTQSGALVGSAFTEDQEPAFANLRLFQALGFTVGYLYNVHLCEYIKLYIAAGTLIVSMIFVAIVEIRIRLKNKPDERLI
ncbi:protein unc-93 homolog A-like [Mytilus trossulus]|uniref:protein unc-93 homolog A-like n=1 Tax=Mytilus trossulus TaxID=6551 RepID=UPI003007BD97